MARRFKPGVRPQYAAGKIGANRRAWLTAGVLQLVHYEYTEEQSRENLNLLDVTDEGQVESGNSIVLSIKKGAGRPLTFGVTSLTERELDMVIDFLKRLEPRIREIIRLRDKVAQDALDKGDDSFSRVYRQVPHLVVRPGVLGQDPEGVLVGPPSVPDGHGDGDDLDGGVPGAGDELADGEAPDAGGSDD